MGGRGYGASYKNAPYCRRHYGLIEVNSDNYILLFRGVIYQQMFGAAMGSPVSPLLANLFMEWLEKQAITMTPVECKPKFWKRYVDDDRK